MKNDYEVRGDITAIFIKNKTYGNMETLISTDNLEQVKSFPNTWDVRLDPVTNYFYVGGYPPRNKAKRQYEQLHRFVTCAEKGMVVDHINHNTLDNTSGNLRVVKQHENCQNRRSENANNTSGIRGVFWNKRYKYWYAQIKVGGIAKYLGRYHDIEDAHIAVQEARSKYHPFATDAI